MCHSALTALVDRWRPETHGFHLPCGELTVTLEDFAMITGLPIDGKALTGRVDSKNWRARVTALIGDCSASLSAQGRTDNRTNGVPFPWLQHHRSGCPEEANEETVEQYARAYVWHLLSQVVFGDCSGDVAPWMFLDFLANWDEKYSWGSTGLAYLYRQVTSYANIH